MLITRYSGGVSTLLENGYASLAMAMSVCIYGS